MKTIEQLKNDPRLAKAAATADCSPSEFFSRLCKNSGVNLRSKKKRTI